MTNDIQDASAALLMWSERHHRTAGGHPTLHVRWGGPYPGVDYTAQELTIGKLSFLCVDVGLELPLPTHLRTARNESDTADRSQCFCARLALVSEWFPQGRAKRIPTKSRVMSLASQLRSGAYQNAQQFPERCHLPRTKLEAKMYSTTHDITSPRPGWNFRGMHLFPPTYKKLARRSGDSHF